MLKNVFFFHLIGVAANQNTHHNYFHIWRFDFRLGLFFRFDDFPNDVQVVWVIRFFCLMFVFDDSCIKPIKMRLALTWLDFAGSENVPWFLMDLY